MKSSTPKIKQKKTLTERVTTGIGSIPSLILHTILFSGCFISAFLHWIDLNTMLLVLTTVVSLEAIYLAIFIQMTVNSNTESLREVEEDIEEIQEDVEEIGEEMDEIQEDIEEMSEDVEEMSKDVDEISKDMEEIQEDIEEMSEEDAKVETARQNAGAGVSLDQLTNDVRRILADLEALKK